MAKLIQRLKLLSMNLMEFEIFYIFNTLSMAVLYRNLNRIDEEYNICTLLSTYQDKSHAQNR